MFVLAVALSGSTAAAEQPDFQIWGEIMLDWIKSEALTLGLDIEPKVLVSKPADDPGWATLDVTPSIEYSRGNWFDVVGELHTGRTRQTDHQNSTEITPRIGFRFHFLSNIRDEIHKEKRPRHRLVLRDYLRVEWRNLYYSDDTPQSSTVRVRQRIETLFPFNRPSVSDDGAIYTLGDAEWYWTQDDPPERFANKQRIRVGIGQRRTY